MKKIITSILLFIALLAMTTGTVLAQEPTPITGTVQSVTFGTDPNTSEPTVIVELLNETDGTTQTVILTVEYATTLGLITTDPTTGEPIKVDGVEGTPIEVNPAENLGGTEDVEEEKVHPVASKLNEFFSELVGVDYDTISTAHDDGFGYGVIAQALWLTNGIGGGTEEFTALLDAKASGDYSNIVLADGSTPSNWGDVVTSLKKGENLGYVMSGKGNSEEGATTEETTTNGFGPGNSSNSNGNSGKSGASGGGSDKNGNNGNNGKDGNNGQGKEKSGNKGGNGKNK